MKKTLSFAAVSALAISAVAVTAPAPVDAAVTTAQPGFYDTTTNTYYTVAQFQSLTQEQKKALVKDGVYLYTGASVISAKDAVLSTNAELPSKYITPANFTAANLDAIYAASQTPVQTGELKVESVSAITKTAVEVKFPALAGELKGATIEVKDNTGAVVAVVAQDLAKGATVASFDFVKAVEKQEGVWKVAGVSVDFDLQAKLAKVYNAADQVKLLAAIKELGLTDVVDANIASYSTTLTKVKETISVTEFTKDVAQKVITDGNKAATTTTSAAAAVKAVNDAKNQVALLAALQNEAFKRVNAEWIKEYDTALTAKVAADKDTVAKIQGLINVENNTKVAAVTKVGVDVAKLTEAKTLVTTYATPETDGSQTASTKALLKEINIQLALADLLAATTPTAFKGKFEALVKLVDNSSTLDGTKYVDANGQAYIKALADITTVTSKDEVSEIADVLYKATDGVNDKQAGTLLAKVATASTGTIDADALFKALTDLGIENLAASNKAHYATTTPAAAINTAAGTSKAAVQTAIDNANISAVAAAFTATDADKLLEALKVLKVKNIVDANKGEYLKQGSSTIVTNVATMSAAVKTINESLTNTNEVNAINDATTATQVKTALDNLGVASYVNAPSGDKLYIAEKVLEKRNTLTTKKFADKAEITTALDTSGIIAAYTTLVGKFAKASLTDTATTAGNLTELGYAKFDGLTAGQKADLAQYIIAKYPSTTNATTGVVTYNDYTSLAEVKTAIDAAITALGF